MYIANIISNIKYHNSNHVLKKVDTKRLQAVRMTNRTLHLLFVVFESQVIRLEIVDIRIVLLCIFLLWFFGGSGTSTIQ